ncbi:hypothetical protein AKO1_009274, partial [Acrasis kona]
MPALFEDAICTGYLLKNCKIKKGFCRRYFKLRGAYLYYFLSDTDLMPRGAICLINAKVEMDNNDRFQINVSGGLLLRRYKLRVDCVVEARRWLGFITEAVNKKSVPCTTSKPNSSLLSISEVEDFTEVTEPSPLIRHSPIYCE